MTQKLQDGRELVFEEAILRLKLYPHTSVEIVIFNISISYTLIVQLNIFKIKLHFCVSCN